MMHQLQDAFSNKKFRPNGLDPSDLSYSPTILLKSHQTDAVTGMRCGDDDWIQIF